MNGRINLEEAVRAWIVSRVAIDCDVVASFFFFPAFLASRAFPRGNGEDCLASGRRIGCRSLQGNRGEPLAV